MYTYVYMWYVRVPSKLLESLSCTCWFVVVRRLLSYVFELMILIISPGKSTYVPPPRSPLLSAPLRPTPPSFSTSFTAIMNKWELTSLSLLMLISIGSD